MKELLEAQVWMLYVKSQDTNVPSLQNGESAGVVWSCALETTPSGNHGKIDLCAGNGRTV